jgi:prevent-host-death family protein
VTTVNVHEAKTHLSRILDRVSAGEEIIIAKAGKPVARLVPLKSKGKARVAGTYAGRIRIAEDFDAPLPDDLLDDFEGAGKGAQK